MKCLISLCSNNNIRPIETAKWDDISQLWYVDVNTMDDIKYIMRNLEYYDKNFVDNKFPSLIFTEINGEMVIEVYDNYIE